MKLPLVLAGEVSNNSAPLPAANPPVPLPVMIIAGDTPLPCACTSIPVVTAPPVYVIVALLPSVNVPVPLPSLITMNWKGLADVMFEVMVTFVGSTITFPVVPPALKLTRPVPEDGLKATLEPAGALKTMFAPDVVILNGVPVAGVWTVKPPLLGNRDSGAVCKRTRKRCTGSQSEHRRGYRDLARACATYRQGSPIGDAHLRRGRD